MKMTNRPHRSRTTRYARQILALVLTASALTRPALADELSGTLKKIHDEGTVVLGVRDAAAPFSYFDGKRTVGYSQTIALQIVDEIKKTLGMPQLKVHEITVSSSNLMPMLLNDQIDQE
jgi:glutamate/aspartate transport system substrate-binding protein